MSRAPTRYLLQSRERETLTWFDYRGVSRRVPHWSRWRTVEKLPDQREAELHRAIKRRFFPLSQWRVLWRGQVLP